MIKKILGIVILILSLVFISYTGCTVAGDGEEAAKWGTAVWGQSKWNQCTKS